MPIRVLNEQAEAFIAPIPNNGGQVAALLFHLHSKLYQRISVIIASLVFSEWAVLVGGAQVAAALLDRLTLHILATGNNSFRLKSSTEAAAR